MRDVYILFQTSNGATYCASLYCSDIQGMVDAINDGLTDDSGYGHMVKDGTILSITFGR